MKKRLSTILQYLVFLGLGVFLAWWSIKDLDAEKRNQISAALQHARFWLVGPVLIILIASHFVRALRWRLLINSIGYHPKSYNAFFAVLIGYLTNNAVPRLGEIMKCTFLSRYEKIPADKLIGTIILERIIDAICLLIVFGITLAIQPHIYTDLINTFFHSGGNEETKKIPGWLILFAVGGLVVIAILLWMLIKKKTIADVIKLFRKIASSIWQGVSAVQHLKKRMLFIVYTIIIWTLYLSGGYIGFLALQETQQYGIKEAFSILSAGSVGMIATPGGIGAYALLIDKTMQVYGLRESISLAFGWLLWIAQTGVILLGGIVSFIAMPYFNKKKKLETA
ncbi:MAG: flippase-like domain-containing protein [Bacteroidetes bacterium]|nr:flippase-like domain-containing protein [Bacteroidota bacterium]